METSEWLQVIAGFGTFFVVVIGVAFGGMELRQEARARRLQGISSLFSEVFPNGMLAMTQTVRQLPDGWDPVSLTDEQTQSILSLTTAYNRLGFYLHAGLVTEKEVFEFTPFGIPLVSVWAKVSPIVNNPQLAYTGRHSGPFWFEYLAHRAQDYWLKNKGKHIANEPIFMPDVGAMEAVMQQAQAARKPAKGAVVSEAAS